MNSNPHNPFSDGAARTAAGCDAEETLRLIASLPAPEGLADRIHEALRSAPRRGRVLAWPSGASASGWMRGAAAAAIAFVVIGGGWGVYSRVQHGQPAHVVAVPLHGTNAGGFANAEAMRKPRTLNGPVLSGPVLSGPVLNGPVLNDSEKAHAAPLKIRKKTATTHRQPPEAASQVSAPQ